MSHSHSKLVAGFFSGLIFLSISTGIAQAQVAFAFQGNDGWTLHAAVDGGQVVGFLATHDPSTIPEGSFANVWFERQSDNSFTAAGNVSDTPTAVAKRIELDKSAVLFGQTALNDPSDPIAATLNSFYVGPFNVTLDPLNKGLAEDDPFQDIIDLLSPQEMELVVELGGHGAVSLSAMAIAANTCQPDPTEGTSAHGVSLLESRLASHADYFDELLTMSEVDWNDPDSFNDAFLGIFSTCCEDEDLFFDIYTVTCGTRQVPISGQDCYKVCTVCATQYKSHQSTDCSRTRATINSACIPDPNRTYTIFVPCW